MALSWTYISPDENISVFEALYELADAIPDLQSTRENLLASAIQGWQAEEKQRAAAELEKRASGRAKNLQQFRADLSQVRNGTHLGWMIWAADVYFANFNDVDRTKSGRERLEHELGLENTAAVLEGLKAFARSGALPTLRDLVVAESKNSYPRLWYAFIAGMDELWLETPSLSGFSDDALKVMVSIDLLIPTWTEQRGGTTKRDARAWKDHIVSTKPEIVKDAYLYLIEAGLRENRQHVTGLYELLNDAQLAPFRGEVSAYLLETHPNLSPQRLEELLQVALTQCSRSFILDLAHKRIDLDTSLSEEQRQLWALAAYLLSPETYQAVLERYTGKMPSIVWRMRALTSYDRDSKNKQTFAIKASQRHLFARIAASHFANVGHPRGGWSGDENAWDAADYVRSLLDALSADRSAQATEALQQLALDPAMVTYTDHIKHALANQRARYREMAYKQPSWEEAMATLSGGPPANVADLKALVVEHLREISSGIGTQNIDVYKDFWNEDSHGRPTNPKIEESARNVLLGLLKTRLDPLGILTEPEGHMVADKRADITAALPGRKLILELKRDIHPELWTAPATQLDRFYTRDPEASGYGVYGVFWYGKYRKGTLQKHPKGNTAPRTALELEGMLNELIFAEQRSKLQAVVIDVSIPDGQRAGAAKHPRTTNPRTTKKAKSKASQLRRKKAKKANTKTSKSRAARGNTTKAPRARRKVKASARTKTRLH